jgi:hypothetical protein
MCLSSIVALGALAAPLVVGAQEPVADGCQRALGADYDQLPVQARQARLTQYAACRKRRAEAFVDRNYGDILREVDAYVANARRVTQGQIGEKAATETRLLQSEQLAARAELEKRYDDEARAILAQATGANRAETNAKRADALRRAREEGAALQSQQSADQARLQAQIRDAYAAAAAHIGDLVYDDRQNLAEQHRQKLEYLQSQFESLANTKPDQSIEEYEAEHGIESAGPSWLTSLFVYVSGLVGKKGADDDQLYNGPVGHIGIRG